MVENQSEVTSSKTNNEIWYFCVWLKKYIRLHSYSPS